MTPMHNLCFSMHMTATAALTDTLHCDMTTSEHKFGSILTDEGCTVTITRPELPGLTFHASGPAPGCELDDGRIGTVTGEYRVSQYAYPSFQWVRLASYSGGGHVLVASRQVVRRWY